MLLISPWIPAKENIFLVINYKNKNYNNHIYSRLLLERYAQCLALENHEVKPGACGLGQEKEEEGIQTGMDTAQTHCHVKVGVQAIASVHKQLHIMEKVQDSSRDEAHQEDGKHQRAGLDVHCPVDVRSRELVDYLDKAHDCSHKRHNETNHGKNQVVVDQKGMRAVVQGQHIVTGCTVELRKPETLLDEELWDDGGTKHPPQSQGHPAYAHPLGHTFVLEREHHSQVALYADAGQRQGRAVEVAIETCCDHSTGGLSENPVVSMEMVMSLKEEG